jgi:hypothetical protein
MSMGAGGRRFPNDAEFGENFKNFSQYGRGSTRFVLLRLEESFAHKERVDLSSTTIEHIMPQTMTPMWNEEIGLDAAAVHTRFIDTFGNLTLTGYNTELGNLPFSDKKAKLSNTHIELNREVLDQAKWGEREITARAEKLLTIATKLWPGPAIQVPQASAPAIS